MFHNLAEQFLTLFVVIDPIGTVPVFIAVTAGVAHSARHRVALRAIVYAMVVLGLFLVGGQFVIHLLGISLVSFQIAGGIILFLFALTMVFSEEAKPEIEAEEAIEFPPSTMAVFPLAIPSIASPGAMLTVVLLTDYHRFSIPEQTVTAILVLVVLGITFLLMLLATPILRLIGRGGAAIISRVMGMILASVAVNNVINAVFELIADPPSVPDIPL
ncbi:MAG: MarC family protein [Pseudomonadota bacterium]